MRRFYAPPENFNQTEVVLDLDETRHLRDVLRLRPGQQISVFDGFGQEFLCEIETIEKQKTLLKILEKISSETDSDLDLILAVALLKGEKFDLVVQKACELGVTKIVPLITKRADIRIKDNKDVEKKLERWRRISLESAKQCRRTRLMEIVKPVDLINFIDIAEGIKLLFAERNGESFSQIKSGKTVTAIIGSEGGWEDSEIDLARKNDFQIITLGGRILRAETAGIVIPALLQNHFGDLS